MDPIHGNIWFGEKDEMVGDEHTPRTSDGRRGWSPFYGIIAVLQAVTTSRRYQVNLGITD